MLLRSRIQRPCHGEGMHDRHDDAKTNSPSFGQISREAHALTERSSRAWNDRTTPRSDSAGDGKAEPVVPGPVVKTRRGAPAAFMSSGALSPQQANTNWSSMTIKLVSYWTRVRVAAAIAREPFVAAARASLQGARVPEL